MTIPLDSIPKINSVIASTVIEAEAVVVNPPKGKVNVFNPLGTFIWEQIDGHRSIQAIVALICAEYEVKVEIATHDTLDFLASLLEREIITLD